MANDNLVNLQVNPELIQPIIKAKIQEAILEAMGGKDNLIEKAVNQIFQQRVNESGNVSSYSSDNKYTWLDITVTKHIKDAVRDSMQELLAVKKEEIKAEMLKQLSSKKSLEKFAGALIDAQVRSISNTWMTKINVEIDPKAD